MLMCSALARSGASSLVPLQNMVEKQSCLRQAELLCHHAGAVEPHSWLLLSALQPATSQAAAITCCRQDG